MSSGIRSIAQRALRRLAMAAPMALLLGAAPASTVPDIELWRLDCGTVFIPDIDFLNDAYAFSGQSKTVAVSCYLIRHGADYMLWDAGLPLSRLGEGQISVGGGRAKLARSLTDQLAQIGVQPAQIGRIALSHYHSDHSGQAASFARSTLMIGAADMAVVRGTAPAFNLDRSEFAPWLTGGAKVDEVTGDRDVFGDGSVTMLATPGHTPGHHSLLVRLATRRVLLTGDLWHFPEQVPINGVPRINTSRAETLASMQRARQIVRNIKADVVIGHDMADVTKLPPFQRSLQAAAAK